MIKNAKGTIKNAKGTIKNAKAMIKKCQMNDQKNEVWQLSTINFE